LLLADTRVFVVEDEALLLIALQDMLEDLGCALVASAQHVADAIEKAQALEFDIAILDVNVNGRRIDPVAEALARRGIPFVFVTGYGRSSLPADLRDRPLLAKPYQPADLETALANALRRPDSDRPRAA
jgi:CheY-like chemotaxis protein